VATVALNAAKNAGILAAQIIGSHHAIVRDKILDYKVQLAQEVVQKYEKLESEGYETYLSLKY
jgi:5-(carboxyamino)imidazole ribonucleotide mutase